MEKCHVSTFYCRSFLKQFCIVALMRGLFQIVHHKDLRARRHTELKIYFVFIFSSHYFVVKQRQFSV